MQPDPKRYQNEPARVRAIFSATMLVIIMVLVCFGVVRWMMAHYGNRKPMSPLAEKNSTQFPSPRLQTNEAFDLRTWQKQQNESLHTYGWMDRSNQIIRIPIEQAMKLMAQGRTNR